VLDRRDIGCPQNGLDEFEWRFNNRSTPYLFEDTMIRLLNAKPMEFKELIDKTA
jgi:hypothetical protein